MSPSEQRREVEADRHLVEGVWIDSILSEHGLGELPRAALLEADGGPLQIVQGLEARTTQAT